MRKTRFDWRWVVVIVVVIVLANAGNLPWPMLAIVLAGAGGYLLNMGWRIWSRGSATAGPTRVKYWRGQRIELPSTPSGRGPIPPLRAIGPALVYVLIGAALALAGIAVLLRNIGG